MQALHTGFLYLDIFGFNMSFPHKILVRVGNSKLANQNAINNSSISEACGVPGWVKKGEMIML